MMHCWTSDIDRGKQSFDLAGVGSAEGGEVSKDDDPFDTYRKRMMLAYRFRPNPLVRMLFVVIMIVFEYDVFDTEQSKKTILLEAWCQQTKHKI